MSIFYALIHTEFHFVANQIRLLQLILGEQFFSREQYSTAHTNIRPMTEWGG